MQVVSACKELLAEQVERIRGVIHRERMLSKVFMDPPRSNNAIADHFMHQVCAAGEDLVIWAGKEEEATSVVVQAI